MTQYSQFKAFKALVIAAFRSIIKSPSAVIFTLAFPLIFILVFGFLNQGSSSSVSIGITSNTDTNTALYQSIAQDSKIKILKSKASKSIEQQLNNGDITAILSLQKTQERYQLDIQASSIDPNGVALLNILLDHHIRKITPDIQKAIDAVVEKNTTIVNARKYKTIDFILPGQLSFSLLAASVFGTAFVFFNLRQTLVLKRFFATPVKRYIILLAEGFARMLFQLLGSIVIILVGKYAFGFTLVHGWITLFNMLFLCVLALMIFMSFGFIISGVAKSESTIPPIANIFTLPQFLLAGTFFSISTLPSWLQSIAKLMPLTHLNDALRQVAFDGVSLWDVKLQIAYLLIWGIIGYGLAAKLFKWE